MDLEREAGGRRMFADLLAASHLMPIDRLPEATAAHARAAGFSQVLIYLGDLQRRVLRLLDGTAESGEGYEREMRVDGTTPGRAYQYGHILPAAPSGSSGMSWWVPLLDGTERLGVLRVTAGRDDARTREDMDRLAALLALIIVSKRTSSDTLAKLARTGPLSIAAEMQWNLMPPSAYADGRVVICASMEPAYRISGDAYEYAIDGPLVHLALFDAMGHDTAAGLCAALTLGACRNARRAGADLITMGEIVEAALIEEYDHRRYATGILATLDTRTGLLSWVNRGHHRPIIIRGSRWSTHPACRPAHPLGTGLGLASTICREQLEPGDRVVLYTDGITEARRPGGEEFGLTRFTDFIIRHHADGLPVPETLRRLVQAVLAYHDGVLQDDATVLLCEWLGPDPDDTGRAATLSGLPEGNTSVAPSDLRRA
ncbi:PP2C family protein-serine/threonine phosphatase [Streptomyces liangshanensis]|uniref:Serine/threonine-protein phosphatase n=1 Tax=Streptomyces liangshanensis TaxID=2717324 RepID=A0A6G9H7D3_9ACTN|nr:PP2C family protein-serine/threonine phosphatase [Streptomyces liangshanensis]QIQ06354.1 serine/threonine-protein phosphatase [Streptomyces liangshanensis]